MEPISSALSFVAVITMVAIWAAITRVHDNAQVEIARIEANRDIEIANANLKHALEAKDSVIRTLQTQVDELKANEASVLKMLVDRNK